MNKNDYNSNFKMKISRSLTDLQNSLDEACRLGLPPHFETTLTSNYAEFNRNSILKNDLAHNLEKIISNKERSMQHTQFIPPTNSAFLSRNEERGSNNSVHAANHHDRYLNVLRSLADDKVNSQTRRSRSHDALNDLNPRIRDSVNQVSMADDLKREVRMLRQRLVEMDDEIMRLRSAENAREDFSSGELCQELRKKIETYRGREEALLGQLNEAVVTIEEAKYEEMQVMMQAEKCKEDLANMEKRFKEYVEESIRKMGNQSEGIEKDVQASIRHVMEELDSARSEIREKFVECQTLREQLKNALCEIDRLNMTMKSVQNDKSNTEHSLDASVARAMMQRDETVSQNNRLQAALSKERSERSSEKSILEEEITDLRKRLAVAENNEVNATQERIILMKECEEMKTEMGGWKQLAMIERRREEEERAAKDRTWEGRLRKLREEISKKEVHFESVIGDAEEVMKTQLGMIERLRGELSSTVREMEGWAYRNRDDKEELQWRLSRTSEEVRGSQDRVRELQEVVEEQGRLMALLQGKNGELEGGKASQDSEILALLGSRNGLMRTVELLQGHVTEWRRRSGDCVCGVFDKDERLVNARLLEHVVAAAL